MYRNAFYGWLRETVAALLRRAVEGGEARAVDVDRVADFLLAALNIDLYLYQRRELGMGRERVLDALEALEAMVLPDHVYIGGGNAKKLDPDTIGPDRTIVPNVSGLLGGIALWERTVS